MTLEHSNALLAVPSGKFDRVELIETLGNGQTINPEAYDRFEAWWYGAAPNSRRAFAADVRAWIAFRRARFQPVLPGGPIDIRDFIRARARAGLRTSSIARQLASLAILHDIAGVQPSPVRDRVVSGELRGLRREEGLSGRGRAAQALPLRLKGDVADLLSDEPLPLSIMALLTTLDLERPGHLRDRVLLLLGGDLGRRRSEYAAINVGDVTAARDGSGTLLIRRSKTDQSGEGRIKFLSQEAMTSVSAWISWRQSDTLPLPLDAPLLTSVDRFGRPGGRLSDDGIRHVLRAVATRGLSLLQPDADPAQIAAQLQGLSGHSFRVGFAQDLTAAGESLASICQAADWRSPTMPTRYAEGLAARSGAVARLRSKLRR